MEASYEEDVPEEKDPNLRTIGDELWSLSLLLKLHLSNTF